MKYLKVFDFESKLVLAQKTVTELFMSIAIDF